MTSLIRIPFADSGDKIAVPETDATGGVNMTQGYGQAYALDPATDPSAKRIEREKMNGLFHLITAAISEIQAAGCVPFINSDDNEGTAYSYGKGAMTILNGVVYQSLADGNVTTPPGASWATLANLSNALSRSNPFGDIKADGSVDTALANLGLGTAAKRNVGAGTNQLPDMSSFPAIRGNNGMQQLPNGGGIVDQWGNVTIPSGAASPGYVDVTFPVAFSSAPWFISLNIFSNNVGRFDLSYSNPSATGFRLHWSSTSSLTVAQQFSWSAKGY